MSNPLRMILALIVAQLGCSLTPSLILSAEGDQSDWGRGLVASHPGSPMLQQGKEEVIEPPRKRVAAPVENAGLQLGQIDWLAQTADYWSAPFNWGQSSLRLVGDEYFSDSNELGLIEVDTFIPSASDVVGGQVEPSFSISEPLSVNLPSSSDQGTESTPESPKAADESPLVANERPVIIFQPAVPAASFDGGAVLQPVVRVLGEAEEYELRSSLSVSRLPVASSQQSRHIATSDAGVVFDRLGEARIRAGLLEENFFGSKRLFDPERERLLKRMASRQQSGFEGVLRMLGGRTRKGTYDVGVGAERLPFALFEIDPTQPFNNLRLRFDAAYGLTHPYRAEYFWSAPPKGPDAPDTALQDDVDYSQARFQFEMGGPRMTVGTEIPLVYVDPETTDPDAGLGDLVLTTKTLMADGERWQLMQVFRTQLATGSSRSGRGNGHVSMEPGLVARYKQNDNLLIHSELKLWFPMGGNDEFSGEILRWGMGAARVLYETDSFALIPTFEFVAWTVLDGKEYLPTPNGRRLDGDTILNLYPGLRIVNDTSGDFGMFELGINGGASVSDMHWYRTLIRLELRWSF